MATNFPTSLDTLTNPTATDTLDSPPHDTQHADANDAIEAIQAKVGIDSSAVTTSLDYRVGQLELGGGSMTTSSTAPSSPSDGDMWYDTDDGRTYVYYDDGTSAQWVEFGAPAVAHGKILQVVSATYSTAETTTSGTLVDTSLTATITPSSASNKVLVIITSPLNVNNTVSTTSSGEGRVGIKRDSTDVYSMNYHMHYFDSANSTDRGLSVNGTITHMDSPATTSATTYTFRFAASGATMTAQYQNQVSTIVLMEVAA